MTDIPGIETWWTLLDEDVRSALEADPGKPLTGAEVAEVTRVRQVGPAGSRWVDGPEEYKFFLSDADQDWVRSRTPGS